MSEQRASRPEVDWDGERQARGEYVPCMVIGVEHTLRLTNNIHHGICRCGWLTPAINLGNDEASLAEAWRLLRGHVAASQPPADAPATVPAKSTTEGST